MQLAILIKKELKQEIRSKETVISMIIFGITVILLFSFAFDAAPSEFMQFLPGLIWMTYFFVAVLGLLRSFAAEKEMDGFAGLLSSPVDRGNIYLAKVIAFWIFLALTQLLTLPLFGLFLSIPISEHFLNLYLICLLTDMAIAAIGILVSGMGLRTRMGEVLIPIILFPMLTPVLIGTTKITTAIFADAVFANYSFWVMLITTFTVIFTLTGYLTFGSISEE